MTRKGEPWTDAEIARAISLRSGGMTTEEIGRALGRTEPGVRDMLHRRQPIRVTAYDKEEQRLKIDAIQGSARLLAEIERVFGSQRRAA